MGGPSLGEVLFAPGMVASTHDGTMRKDAGWATNWEPFWVGAGDVLRWKGDGYAYRPALYLPMADGEFVYSYSYQAESVWADYRPDVMVPALAMGDTVFPADGFVRLSVCRTDGRAMAEAPDVSAMAVIESPAASRRALGGTADGDPARMPPRRQAGQGRRVAERVAALREPGDLLIALLSDVHAVAGGIWETTLADLRATLPEVRPDAIVQLGDLTDGVSPLEVTKSATARILGGLRSFGLPVYGCLGNHDYNYFRKNPDFFDVTGASVHYLGREVPWYHVDFEAHAIRAIFLDTFDPLRGKLPGNTRDDRYGFADAEVPWLARTLVETPAGWSVIVFSHVPPVAEIHEWSKTIYNGETVMGLLEGFHHLRGGAILAYVHGHSHADQVYLERAFPIVGVGCSKLESFGERKPEGSVTPGRVRGTDTEDLWDVLVVSPARGSVDFVRYGAGEDRRVTVEGGARR